MTIRNTRTGGQILIDQLVAQGVERVTCVPGESYLAALDALHEAIQCRRAGKGAQRRATEFNRDTRCVARLRFAHPTMSKVVTRRHAFTSSRRFRPSFALRITPS